MNTPARPGTTDDTPSSLLIAGAGGDRDRWSVLKIVHVADWDEEPPDPVPSTAVHRQQSLAHALVRLGAPASAALRMLFDALNAERLATSIRLSDLTSTQAAVPSLRRLSTPNITRRRRRPVWRAAIYFADPEIELAFITLFGTFGERFFARYREHRPISSDFFELRRDLYNLYPLLVHVRLFGGGYVGQIRRIVDRLAA